MTLAELREQHPELVAQIEADARTAGASEAATNAVQAEQARIQAIDEVANLFDPQMVQEAKYGEKACSAQELAYRAAQNAAKQGRNFLANLEADNKDSGANGVAAAPGKGEEAEGSELTPEQKLAKARATVADIFGKNKEE